MAKVHKAHKSGKKYSFQRNKKATIAWIVGIVVVIAAIVLGINAYNNTRTTELDVPVVEAERLNNIAQNWEILASHADKFAAIPQEDGSVTLQYFGSAHATDVMLFVNHGVEDYESLFGCTYTLPNIFSVDLSMLTSGQIDMNAGELFVLTGNENLVIRVGKYPAAITDTAVVDAIIAELEAIVAEGPVVTESSEETPEETPETAEETPEEAPETAEETPAEVPETPAE